MRMQPSVLRKKIHGRWLALSLPVVALLLAISASGAVPAIAYVFESQPLPLNERKTTKAKCPAGTQVANGGFSGASMSKADDTETDVSRPFDSGDRGSKVDDGWMSTAYNDGTLAGDVNAHAVCLSVGEFVYRTRSKTVVNTNTVSKSVPCPSGTRVTGGGAWTDTPFLHREIASSGPVDGPDNDTKVDDMWAVRVVLEENPKTQQTLHAYAICARNLRLSYHSTNEPGTSEDLVPCPSGRKVVGGGVVTQGTSPDTELVYSAPFDSDDPRSQRDDGWSAGVRQVEPSVWAVTSICRVT